MLPEPEKALKVSGLEAWTVSDPSDCVTPDFSGLLADEAYDEALMLAGEQLADGAALLDICLDGLPETPAKMERFVRLTQGDPSVSCSALMIHSADWETLLQGLKNAQGKCIARSISLSDGEFLEKAATLRSLGAAIVVKVEGETDCDRALSLLGGIGIPPEEILFERGGNLFLV